MMSELEDAFHNTTFS